MCRCCNYVNILLKVFLSYTDLGNSIFFCAGHCIYRGNTFCPFLWNHNKKKIGTCRYVLTPLPGSFTLGDFRWICASLLLPFRHSQPWIFSSVLRQEPVRTSLRGHPGGHWGANQASGQGSLVIIMQGIFSLPSTEERQRDTGHRLLTHSWQPFALCDFKPAAF